MAWIHYILDATAAFRRPLAYNTETQVMLERQGFVDIKHEVIEIPLNVGRWYQLGLIQGLEALTLAPMTRMRGWQKEDVDQLTQEVRRELCNGKVHAFCNM
jgi:hypothetical protein